MSVSPSSALFTPTDIPGWLASVGRCESLSTYLGQLEGRRPVGWHRVPLAAHAPLVAVHRQALPGPLLVLVPLPTEIDPLLRDISFLTGGSACLRLPLVEPWGQADGTEASDAPLDEDALTRLQTLGQLLAMNRSSAAVGGGGRDGGRSGDAQASLSPVVVSCLPAIMHPVPHPDQLLAHRQQLQVGRRLDIGPLRKWLLSNGYHSTTSVQLPGEFAVRGGIIDIFPPEANDPVRIELFDEEIESIRSFCTTTQRSVGRSEAVQLMAVGGGGETELSATLLDYLPPNATLMLFEPESCWHRAEQFYAEVPFPQRLCSPDRLRQLLADRRQVMVRAIEEPEEAYPSRVSPFGSVERYVGLGLDGVDQRIDQLAREQPVLMVCLNPGERDRISDLLREPLAKYPQSLQLVVGPLSGGFEVLPDGPLVLPVSQLLGRVPVVRGTRRVASRAIDSFLDLRPGDLVVHLAHGIGIYRGLQMLERQGRQQEHLELEFDDEIRIYVPTSKIDLVQRYVGGTKSKPKLAKIGGQLWLRQKKAAERAVADMASDLLELQARRQSLPGIAFGEDSGWQQQFEAAFPYQETPDQLTAIAAVKADMAVSRPMERLICGDVGFGKTEVAMRAAFKAVEAGYQVAVLVPTTVLAEQHYKTFKQRMQEFPFDIGRLSRFCSRAEQRELLDQLRGGRLDIVIGTHRLASRDVDFFNLGLVIIDEEQRFGVEVKERLKHLRARVDSLTLSATPIPRTLHMSLLGARDISNLETAPEERLAVETRVVRFSDELIRRAILRELHRDGQIYFVHNRIKDIYQLAERLQRIVPEMRLVVGHGQMPEEQLEKTMLDFIEHRYDLLLSTTIIESGLDIPNANTIFIDQADQYGLAELHQLRGRVGRYRNQAYCFLLVDPRKHVTSDAARRLHAIEEYSQIGAGFGIAMRDLEIRGAGNLLGPQQSGHIAAVGYELYCQMLEKAVRELTHQPSGLSLEVDINLPIDAFIPEVYIPEMRQKIDLYRRLSRIDSIPSLDDLKGELRDRFGPIPPPVQRLLEMVELRIDAALWLIRGLSVEPPYLVFYFADRSRMESLVRRVGRQLRIVDNHRAYYEVPEGEEPFAIAQTLLRSG
jgi:transcription-repair coupling factor (superfamily II helicase)